MSFQLKNTISHVTLAVTKAHDSFSCYQSGACDRSPAKDAESAARL